MPTSREPASSEVRLRVPFAASSVPLVRRRLRTWLSAQVPPISRVEDARVVASELVANAVKHASPLTDGGLLVTWRLVERKLHLSVADGGGTSQPTVKAASPASTSGRGLLIVQQIANQWWVESNGTGTTVHATLLV